MSTSVSRNPASSRRRVLFVDDQPFALEALERIFEPMRNEWHMEFVTGGPEALARLEKHAFDAVVSDLKMPGMTGSQLFEEMMFKHPAVCRIILSDEAEEELVFTTINTAHQFISKRGDPKQLIKRLRKLLLLRQAGLRDELVEVICAIEHLPTIPQIYCELVDALARRETSLADMADIIGRDAAMTAKVLQLANSAFFGLRGEVTSILEAITFVGVETVRYLVLMVGICQQFELKQFPPGFAENIWSHSVQTANFSRMIAQAEGASLVVTEQAFVAGLLHDIGKLVFAENLARNYREVLDFAKLHGQPSWEIERQILKATHAEVGAYLLDLWGLPEAVTKAIGGHHQPIADGEHITPLAIVHVANHFAHALDSQNESAAALDDEFLEKANLTDRVAHWQQAVEASLEHQPA